MYMLNPHSSYTTALAYEDSVGNFGVLVLGVQHGMLLLPDGSQSNIAIQPRKSYWVYTFNNSMVCSVTRFSGGITAQCPEAGIGWDARFLSFA
jgi:hypothetical protein